LAFESLYQATQFYYLRSTFTITVDLKINRWFLHFDGSEPSGPANIEQLNYTSPPTV
jgi:hypothetical protein